MHNLTSHYMLANDDLKTLPLQFPFFICQFGGLRSGFTFQTNLLQAIVDLEISQYINIVGVMIFILSHEP